MKQQTKKTGKVVVLTVLTVAALFYVFSRVAFVGQTMEIKATPDRVFELINRPANWADWYTPLRETSGVNIRFIGTSAGKGAGMKWTGNSPYASTGMMKIRSSKNNRNVKTVVTTDDKRSAVMNFRIRPLGTDAAMLTISTRLQFRKDSHDLKMIENLKNIDEAAISVTGGIDVQLQRIDSFSYISIVDSCALEDVSQRLSELYNELLAFAVESGMAITTRPIAIYHRFSEKQAVFEAGIPVVEKAPVSGRIRYQSMQGGDYVVANYYGSHDTLGDGHNAVQQWIARHRRKLSGYPWEMFVTEPATEPDPNKWLTMIFYPVE